MLDTYGSTEIGPIAHSCGSCDAFHLLDGLFPETGPTALAGGDDLVGERSEAVVLVVSSVKRTSFPVVRFVAYDVVRGPSMQRL